MVAKPAGRTGTHVVACRKEVRKLSRPRLRQANGSILLLGGDRADLPCQFPFCLEEPPVSPGRTFDGERPPGGSSSAARRRRRSTAARSHPPVELPRERIDAASTSMRGSPRRISRMEGADMSDLSVDDMDLTSPAAGRPLRVVLMTFYNYSSHAMRIFHPLLKRVDTRSTRSSSRTTSRTGSDAERRGHGAWS